MSRSIAPPIRSFRSYATGFILACLLTLAAFSVAVWPGLGRSANMTIIIVAGFVQLFVHLRWFLHLDPHSSPRDQLLFLLLAGLFVAIMFGGSFWVMADLNSRMMPY